MKRPRLLVLGAALPLVAGVTVATAAPERGTPGGTRLAASTSGTECRLANVTAVFMPGLSTEPGRGSYYSKPGGTITCNGPVDGGKPTGAGEYSSAGWYGTTDPDSCSSGGEGWGVQTLQIPTDAGTKVIRSAFTMTYGGLQGGGVVGGVFRGDYVDGSFQAKSLDKGNCVTVPMTEATFDGTLTLHEYRVPEG